jgi:hypothetical protein
VRFNETRRAPVGAQAALRRQEEEEQEQEEVEEDELSGLLLPIPRPMLVPAPRGVINTVVVRHHHLRNVKQTAVQQDGA